MDRCECVLIADDDPGIRLLLRTFLRRRGFRLLEARNGREALADMRAGAVDLAILDLVMPEVSGWDVLRERAGEELLASIPMIVITATDLRDAALSLAGRDVQAVLSKPFDLDVLMKAVMDSLPHPVVPTLNAA